MVLPHALPSTFDILFTTGGILLLSGYSEQLSLTTPRSAHPPPQVFSAVWLGHAVETKALRSSSFYPRWAFEYVQVVLVFTLD